MAETEKSVRDFDPIYVKDKVVKTYSDYKQSTLDKMHWTNPSYPYVQTAIEAIQEAGRLNSRQDFDSRLETLGLEHYSLRMAGDETKAGFEAERMSQIQFIYECLRYFWEEKGPFDFGALYSVQRAVDFPVWSDAWQFREQAKPPHQFSENYGSLNDFYQSLEAGSLIRVKPDIAEQYKIKNGLSGEVLGFTIGFQAQWNMDYLFVNYKDQQNWTHQRWLYQLEPDLNHPRVN